jgi:hypothetical protein
MSEVLRQLFYILDEGSNLLDRYVDFPGKESLEECCLLVLKILERGLELQPKVLEMARFECYKTFLSLLMLLGKISGLG